MMLCVWMIAWCFPIIPKDLRPDAELYAVNVTLGGESSSAQLWRYRRTAMRTSGPSDRMRGRTFTRTLQVAR